MVKHILGMSIYQSIILFTFVFAGPLFIRELGDQPWDDSLIGFERSVVLSHPNPKISDWDGKYVVSGMVQGLDGQDIYRHFEGLTPSRHLTVVFNLFVLFQIFNMIGARKINDEINILDGVHTNAMFVAVWLVIVFGQIFIVQYGGWALKVHKDGLTIQQWLLCLWVAATSLIWNMILKFVPDKICPTLGDEDPEDVQAAKDDYAKIQ
jgi:magnesium-transporting ATPase (P-type)